MRSFYTRCRSACSACPSRPRSFPALSAIVSARSATPDGGRDPGAADVLRRRLDAGLRQIAFFVVPSAVAFIALGDVIAAAVFETGRFDRADTVYVWAILAGSAIGLLPSTLGRLYSSTYYALRDTRTPLRYARRPRLARDRARVPLRDPAAAMARNSSHVGGGRVWRYRLDWPAGSKCCCCAGR